MGHAVSVLTTDALAPHERLPHGEKEVDGVRVIRVRNVSGVARTSLHVSTPLGLRRSARQLFRHQPVDILHLHEVRTIENLALLAVRPPGVVTIISPHGTIGSEALRSWTRRLWDRWIEDRVLREVDHLLAASDAEADEIQALYRSRGRALHPAQITVVPDGVAWPAIASSVVFAYGRLISLMRNFVPFNPS
jgi:hypothetical protein